MPHKLFLWSIAAAILLLPSSSVAESPGAIREIPWGTAERATRNVINTIGGRTYKCIGKSVLKVWMRQSYRCTATQKLPWCAAPGQNRPYCPEVCSQGGWVNQGTREEYLREIVTDCNPLGDPATAR